MKLHLSSWIRDHPLVWIVPILMWVFAFVIFWLVFELLNGAPSVPFIYAI